MFDNIGRRVKPMNNQTRFSEAKKIASDDTVLKFLGGGNVDVDDTAPNSDVVDVRLYVVPSFIRCFLDD